MTSDTLAESLTRRLTELVGGAAVTHVLPMPGGYSSLTYRACLDSTAIVVKVAPPGHSPVGNRDVLRQARILEVLRERSTVPVPEVLFVDHGEPPEVPPLFGMSLVDGDVLEPMLTHPDDLPAPDVVAARAQDLTRLLARLQSSSLNELGLLDEPAATPAAEVSRWTAMFSPSHAPVALTLGRRLAQAAPPSCAPVLQHGDFRLGNVLCRGRAVVAVIDWEIWSVGDPRVDLAWLLMRAAPDQLHSGLPSAPGMPTSDALRALYESEVGHTAADLEWFCALARYKYAAVVSRLASRSGATNGPIAMRATAVPALLAEAEGLIRGRY